MKLGYACINKGLSEQPKTKRITTNRTMRRATFEEKGLAYASEVFLQNSHDLMKILHWNEQHNIKFFRLSFQFRPLSSVDILMPPQAPLFEVCTG